MKYQSFGNILNNLIRTLGIEREVLEYQAINVWPKVVGTKIAENTNAERVRDGILFVKVKSDVWRNELIFYKQNLVKKLNSELGKQIISDIILV